MRDADVREAVRQMLAVEHAGDADTKVVEEMGVWSGSVRIDLAVINGQLTGYELKSDRDTLERLPAQAELYSRVFDKVCLVVGAKHAGKARRIVPRWWGVIVANPTSGAVRLEHVREAKLNPKPDPVLVARLLWRDEVIVALEGAGLVDGFRSKPVGLLHQRLADSLSWEELSRVVRTTLKNRTGWLGQPIRDERKVPVRANFDPGLAAPWGS